LPCQAHLGWGLLTSGVGSALLQTIVIKPCSGGLFKGIIGNKHIQTSLNTVTNSNVLIKYYRLTHTGLGRALPSSMRPDRLSSGPCHPMSELLVGTWLATARDSPTSSRTSMTHPSQWRRVHNQRRKFEFCPCDNLRESPFKSDTISL
jgi:hypothetical protein